jgi:hypothetical protein
MIRNATIVGATLTLALFADAAKAGCDYPASIDIPNGAQASKDEMIEGQRAIKGYMEAMNTYLDCIDLETRAAIEEGEAPEVTAERERLLGQKHNAAVEEMEKLAAEFNAQVRAYKARGD